MDPENSNASTQLSENMKEIDDNRVVSSEEKAVLPKEDKVSSENSEYDSVDSYSDEEQDVKIRSRASDQGDQSHSDAGSVILEREEGDGQESVPIKKVDDDEDKKNPQYIPKRGTFYEHDDRTADEPETAEAAQPEKETELKKKVWQDNKERWTHDRFNDSEQTPKTCRELISIYGYDIRNEDGPPRARRRRRYGRGPNKYTRNWEDEDAYNKPPPPRTKKQIKPKDATEEFPPLVRDQSRTVEYKPPQIDSQISEQEISTRNVTEKNEPRKSFENLPPQVPSSGNTYTTSSSSNQETFNNKTNQQYIGSGRVAKPIKEIKDSDYRGFTTKTRQQRNIKVDKQKVLPRNQPKEQNDYIQTQNFTNKNSVQEVEKELSKLSVMDGGNKGKHSSYNSQRQSSVPPRLQSEQKGSKRYSSMRQRSLPEANTPPVPNYQHASFYPNDYQQSSPNAPQSQLIHQNPQIHPTANPCTQLPPPTLPPIPQQVPVTAAPLLQAPFPQAFPQPPPAFLQPAVAPSAFIPQPQTPQIINYVQGQPPFTPNYQGLIQQQFNPVTQPAELYQPQGGITYYSTDQQVAQRPAPQKRPKAAIPIVAPPSNVRKEDSTYSSLDATVDRNEYKEDFEIQQ